MIEYMTNSPQWPLLNQQSANTTTPADSFVSEPERDRAERYLHQALRDGRLNASEFQQRFAEAMYATQRSQLQAAIGGIPAGQVLVVASTQFGRSTGARQTNTGLPAQFAANETGLAALAHASGLVSWILGPALFWATARPGSIVRREAAKAFNFQLSAALALVGLGMVLGVLGLGGLMSLVWLGWLGLTLTGTVMASRGNDWANPVTSLTKIAPLDPR